MPGYPNLHDSSQLVGFVPSSWQFQLDLKKQDDQIATHGFPGKLNRKNQPPLSKKHQWFLLNSVFHPNHYRKKLMVGLPKKINKYQQQNL